MVPPPDWPHDDLDARLNKALLQFLIARNIQGEVLHPRASIYTDADAGTYLEPEMMYVSGELRERLGQKRTSADIVFEYLSQSTTNYHRTTKADTYLALGVIAESLIRKVLRDSDFAHAFTQESCGKFQAGVREDTITTSRCLPLKYRSVRPVAYRRKETL